MLVSLAALTLAAAPLPVLAILEPTKETFAGTFEDGVLLLRSDAGPSCHSQRQFGLLVCSDGRTGHFHLERTMLGWLGYGTLAGKDLVITIG